MLTINVICVGKLKEKYLKDAIAEYSKRLSKYCKLNIIELSDEKVPDKINESIENEIKNIESENYERIYDLIRTCTKNIEVM